MTTNEISANPATFKSYRLYDGEDWSDDAKPAPKLTPAQHNAFPLGRWTESPGRCCAYDEEERCICGRPAKFLDVQRGGLVCEKHHREGGVS